MIYQLTNALLIPALEEMAKTVPGASVSALRDMLVETFRRKDSRIFVDEKDGKINGFIFGTVEQFEGQDAVFIQFCVVRPGNEQNIFNELLAKMRKWTREAGLKHFYFMTGRNPRAFERRTKMTFHAAVLKGSV